VAAVQRWVLLVSGMVTGWYLPAIVAWLQAERAVANQIADLQRSRLSAQ
jgi:endonuclease/exonuclease/phosphatase (EEP) superfamily protein YafD